MTMSANDGTGRMAIRFETRPRRRVHLQEVAPEGRDDVLVPVEDDVDGEVDAGAGHDRPYVVVDGIALADPPGGVRVGDATRIVQHEHRVQARPDPGATIFGPPEKPAKKCGSTKPVVMRMIGRAPLAVEPDRHMVAEFAPPGERAALARVVIDHPHGIHDLVTEHRPYLGVGPYGVGVPRCVPVATRTTMSSRSTKPSNSSRIAPIISWRGWGRVASHIEMATVRRPRTRSRSGGPETGSRSARRISSA